MTRKMREAMESAIEAGISKENAAIGAANKSNDVELDCTVVRGSLHGTISAECPHCSTMDGYFSTGTHTITDTQIVRCSVCGRYYNFSY